MKYKRLGHLMICCVLLSYNLRAQTGSDSLPTLYSAREQYFSSVTGYSRTCTSDVFFDKDGRIWLSTCNSEKIIYNLPLIQLNGYQFIPAKTEDLSISNGAAANFIHLSEDDQLMGYLSKDTTVRCFFSYQLDTQQASILSMSGQVPDKAVLRSAFRTSKGEWYFFLKNGTDFLVYEKKDSQFIERLSIPYEFYPEEVIDIKPRPIVEIGDEIWFMDFLLPIVRWNRKSGTWKKYDKTDFPVKLELASTKKRLPWDITNPFMLNHRQQLIACFPEYNQRHFFYYNTETDRFQIIEGFPKHWLADGLYNDEAGNVIYVFKTKEGAYKAILENQQGQQFDYSPVLLGGDGEIFKLKGTDFRKSIMICSRAGFIIKTIRYSNAIRNYLSPYSTRAITQLPNDDILLNASIHGWYAISDKSGSAASFIATDCVTQPFHKRMSRKAIAKEDHTIWTYKEKEIIAYNPIKQSCTSYPLTGSVHTFAFINEDSIVYWDADHEQLAFLNTRSGEIGIYKEGKNNWHIDAFIQDLQASKDGQLWIVSNEGLWKIDYKNQKSILIGKEHGFKDFRFNTLLEDEDGVLWIGTFTAGLHIYNPENGHLRILDREQGLANNRVTSILKDNEGIFWIGTYNGLSMVSSEGYVLANLSESDGLVHREFNRFSSYKIRDGRLVMGTIGGVNVIDPAKVKKEFVIEDAPKVFLTSITYYDKDKGQTISLDKDVDFNERINLPATQRSIQLKFALSSYIEPENNQFAYKLEGINKEWQYIGNQHNLSLSNMPPGRYNILIKGNSYRGRWSDEPIVVKVRVKDFFYNQIWFYLLCISVVGFIAFIWINYLRGEKRRLEQEVQYRTQQIRQDKELIEHQAEELRRLDNIKSKFFTNVSHELRTPVTLIFTPLTHLLKQYGKGMRKELKSGLEIVYRNAQKLLVLVEELLELASLDAGKQELNLSTTLVKPYFEQLFIAFESWATFKKIDLHIDYNLPENICCQLDKKYVAKIFNNLLSNALKFTPEDGKVEVQILLGNGIRKQEEISLPAEEVTSLKIICSDTGQGIPKEDIPFIFDRYFQSQHQSISHEAGTGIGLSLSKELTQLMGGVLEVESIWGKGSTFTCSIPVQLSKKKSIELPDLIGSTPYRIESTPELVSNNLMSSNGGKTTILIVEDNRDMQQLLITLLADQYHCLLANNGLEAWNALNTSEAEAKAISLIISDVMMPQMNGYELLNHIKRDKYWRRVPVIMLTSKSVEKDKLYALRLGVDDYLSKPFSPEELKIRIANLIRNYQERKTYTAKQRYSVDVEFKDIPSAQEEWLKKLEDASLDAINKGQMLNSIYLANKMNLSDRQLLRRLKELTGLSIKKYIQLIKLQKARHLLENKTYQTVAEVSYACGFNTPSYFTRIYKQEFGKRPSEYLGFTE